MMILKAFWFATAITLGAMPVTAQDAAREFVVQINEPFLSFETQGEAARVISPEDSEGTVVPLKRLEVAGVVQVVGDYQGERFVVTIVKEACQDDMAGLPYSHSAALSWGDTLKSGCARLSTEPQPGEGG